MVRLFIALAFIYLIYRRGPGLGRRFIKKSWEITYLKSGLEYPLEKAMRLYAQWNFIWILTSGLAVYATNNATFAVLPYFANILPYSLLKKYANQRAERIYEELPTKLEILSTILQSGHDIIYALEVLSKQPNKTPLHQELKRALEFIKLGITQPESFKLIFSRTQIAFFADLASSIEQSERFGTSLSSVFKNHALNIRRELFEKYELRAQKLPYKMLVPLFVLIFPVTLLLLLSPLALLLKDIAQP